MTSDKDEVTSERFERLETKVDDLGHTVGILRTRLDRVDVGLEKLESRVGRVEVQLEDLRETVTRFENTMGARFDALDRRLEERDKQFAAQFQDIHLVLKNHNQRITVLERRRKRRT